MSKHYISGKYRLKRGRLFLILAACLLAGIPAGCSRADSASGDPAFTAKNYLELVNNQQYEDAYRMLSSTFKDRLGPLDDYIYQNIYNLEYGRTPVYSDIEVTGVHGKKYAAEIDWQGRWTKRDGREAWRAGVAIMVLEDGTWRVDSVVDSGKQN